jgi:hypothetical protein
MLQLATINLAPDKQIVPFQPNHLYSLELKDYELEYVSNIPNYDQYIIQNADPLLTWTAVVRGKIILIFGVRPFWPHVYEAWMLPGAGIEDNAIAVVRGARKILTNVMQEYDMMRLQIAVRVSNDTAYKFAKSLYFKEEAIMRQFGPEGADYYLMTRFV